jgi:hypothetical protein
MSHDIIERNGFRLLLIATDGPALVSYRDATDLVGDALSEGVAAVVIPAARLDPAFFQLRSGVAGEFIQKIVQYRLKLAIIGDISAHTAKSEPLRDFVRESNRGTSVFFLDDLDAVLAKLGRL